MAHERLRDGLTATAVRAGSRIVINAQSGFDPDGVFIGLGDPAAQAEQALHNVQRTLAAANAAVPHICKLTTYVTDRAWLGPVDAVVAHYLGPAAPVRTWVLVAGLAEPHVLVAIEIDAVVAS